MKESLTDLHSILFEQLERLSKDDISDEDLNKELKRSEAVTGIANQIIQNGNLVLKALKTKTDTLPMTEKMPAFLDVGSSGQKCIGYQKK